MQSNDLQTQAHEQWANRPADERFRTLTELADSREAAWGTTEDAEVPAGSITAHVTAAGTLAVAGERTGLVTPTSWSFEQVANLAGAPSEYLRKLTNQQVADLLNYGIEQELGKVPMRRGRILTVRGGDDPTLLSLVSKKYERVGDHILARWAQRELVEQRGFLNPWARAEAWGVGAIDQDWAEPFDLSDPRMNYLINVPSGTMVAPSGLYAGDRDMFCFLIDPEKTIDDGGGNALHRGVLFGNSAVGARKLWIRTFLFAAVCGNHFIWGAQEGEQVDLRHIGNVQETWQALFAAAVDMLGASSQEDEELIRKARTTVLGGDGVEPVEHAYRLSMNARTWLRKKQLSEAHSIAKAHTDRYGDPDTLWAMVNGLTQLSQAQTIASKRTEIDAGAGALMLAGVEHSS